ASVEQFEQELSRKDAVLIIQRPQLRDKVEQSMDDDSVTLVEMGNRFQEFQRLSPALFCRQRRTGRLQFVMMDGERLCATVELSLARLVNAIAPLQIVVVVTQFGVVTM